ncbi:MAG: 6-carboxytetrahydropterin synthase [Chloroflexi bacterium]|nr:6-carboxytetrahydropterin synthase [Chloroflexota bacterium]
MSQSPRCSNCQEEIVWIPVYQTGEPYCCEGCAKGGPCICTYDGPPPKLNTRDILVSAGYDTDALASELTMCANCFEELRKQHFLSKDIAYCCFGCAQGGPCTCTYQSSPAEPVLETALIEEESDRETPPDSPVFKTNPYWDMDGEASPHTELDDQDDAKSDGLWSSPVPAGPAIELTPPSSEVEIVDSEGPVEQANDPLPAFAEMPDIKAYERHLVHASPLSKISDVNRLASLIERVPSVQSLMLTYYARGRATYQMESESINAVIKEIIEAGNLPIDSLNLTPDGLLLSLRSEEEASASPAGRRAGAQPGSAHEMDDDQAPRPFMYEIGVDVFFNGRHYEYVEENGEQGPVHMHSWRAQAILLGESSNDVGIVVGTEDVKEIIEDLVSLYNESLLNKVPPFDEIMPTSNNIARVIYEYVMNELVDSELELKAVRLWESPTSYVEYSGEGFGSI